MADYGKKIIEKREEFVEELNELAKGLHKGLFGKVKYKTIKHRKEIITEADWKNGKKVSLYED